MKQHVKLGIAFVAGGAAAGLFATAVLSGREHSDDLGTADHATPTAPPSVVETSVASAPLRAELTPTVSQAPTPAPAQPQTVATTAPAAASDPLPAASEDRVASMMERADQVVEEKGYDAETAMRYRVHIARNMARQGLNDARLAEWVKGQ
jgi:type IV secretory pathway VirB10-like protein